MTLDDLNDRIQDLCLSQAASGDEEAMAVVLVALGNQLGCALAYACEGDEGQLRELIAAAEVHVTETAAEAVKAIWKGL